MVKKVVKKVEKKEINKKEGKEIKLKEKGVVIKHFLKKGINGSKLTNSQIAKISGLSRGLVYYYDKRPEILFEKKRSKLPPYIIQYIYRQAANKKISEINGRVLAEKVNKKLEKDGVVNKKGKLITISKSQINRILKNKFGKARNKI